MAVKGKEKLAKKMQTSSKYLYMKYIQILPNTQTSTRMATIESNTINDLPLNAYQKQLRSKHYY